MSLPLHIGYLSLEPAAPPPEVCEMTGRCAFVVCTKGDFEVKILNRNYEVSALSMLACMPFLTFEVTAVREECELVYGYISVQDIPVMINRWVNTDNLSAIQDQPLVKLKRPQLEYLLPLIEDYVRESRELENGTYDNVCRRIQMDVIDLQSRRIVAQVLKLFFANMAPMDLRGHEHKNIVFQKFMISLYSNFKTHRDVRFYAAQSGLSLKYFSTIVRSVSGLSPSAWIKTLVVREAMSMLNEMRHSVKDIANALNFPDAPTFTKYFHRVQGLTPKAYRQKFHSTAIKND